MFRTLALVVLFVFGSSVPAEERGGMVQSVPDPVRQKLRLADFYEKYIDVGGLPVIASGKVRDEALVEAAYLIRQMLANRDDVLQAIAKNRIRFVVMSPKEQTTDVPEHSDLKPKEYWDRRARGLGATRARPAVSCGEENLLCLPGDRYSKENILVHEFSHTVHQLGLNSLDRTFDEKLRKTYQQAMDRGLWKNTYAATNHAEYWAEAVQSYFDCNNPPDHQHNQANTREKLAEYDPALFKLIDEAFRQPKWRYVRYDRRQRDAKE